MLAAAHSGKHHCGAQRGEALGDPGVGHFQRRGGSEGTFKHAHDQAKVVESGEIHGGRPGRINFRIGASRLWRRTDNAGADKLAAGRSDHVRDFQHCRRADRVAFHVDRLPIGGSEYWGEALGERERVARRNDRQQEIGFCQSAFLDWLHTRFARAFCAALAPAGERGEHRYFVFSQAPADTGTHFAWFDDCNGRRPEPVTPPSRLMLWPVTKEEASEARNSTEPTKSSGTSARGTHCMAIMRSFCVGVTVLRSISVKVAPGKMAFTVMPSAPNSRAIDKLIPASAALLAM